MTEQARTTSRAGTGSGSSPPFTPDVSQVSSVTQSWPTLCDPMDCSTPGLPVHHQLLELAQTHVHGVSDAIQPPHPLSAAFSFSGCREDERKSAGETFRVHQAVSKQKWDLLKKMAGTFPFIKDWNSLNSEILSDNSSYYGQGCHLAPLLVALWELGLRTSAKISLITCCWGE